MDSKIDQAARAVRSGGIVVFPTETVYGLGADAFQPQAVARVFEIKARPLHHPLIVHVENLEWVFDLAIDFPSSAQLLAKQVWPGPLTLVLPRRESLPSIVCAGGQSVAVRVPNHPMALELLHLSQTPIAAPSANRFGRLSPTCVDHLDATIRSNVDVVLDGGACSVGVESTIIAFDKGEPELLRPGGLPLEQIESLIGRVRIPASPTPRAPGMLAHHYQPRTRLWLAGDKIPPGRLGCIAFDHTRGDRFESVELLSPRGDLREAASRLYDALYRLDRLSLDGIIAMPFPERDLGIALNDRLRRAAH